jgi:hypothetical protein
LGNRTTRRRVVRDEAASAIRRERMLAWTIILVIGVVRGFATGANMPVDRLPWQPIDRPFPAHGSASL